MPGCRVQKSGARAGVKGRRGRRSGEGGQEVTWNGLLWLLFILRHRGKLPQPSLSFFAGLLGARTLLPLPNVAFPGSGRRSPLSLLLC